MKKILTSESSLKTARGRQSRIVDAVLDSPQTKPTDKLSGIALDTDTFGSKTQWTHGNKTADTTQSRERNFEDIDLQLSFSPPDITFCPYLTKCPIEKTKRCFFNFKYENCQSYKFYERWGK